MLASRVIPCLDVDHGRVVKGTNFLNLRDAGDPVEVARPLRARRARMSWCFSISPPATKTGDIMIDVVQRTAEQVFMPLTVGGGIRTLEDIRSVAELAGSGQGLDQLGRLPRTPNLSAKPPMRFGQSVHCGEHRSQAVSQKDGRELWEVHINGGRKRHRPGGGPLGAARWSNWARGRSC